MPEQNLSEEQTYEVFIQKILNEKGLQNKNQQEISKVREALRKQLDEVIQRAIVESLTDEQLDRLDQLLEAEAPDSEIETFFDQANIDYAAVANKALQRFRADFLADVDSIEMTDNANTMNQTVSMGQPVQGTVSETPGISDVEGRANIVNMAQEEER